MAVRDPEELARWQLQQVREALELLAADSSAQIAYLEHLGTAPSLDELALEFDDARRLIPGLVERGDIPEELERVAVSLDDQLDKMNGRSNLWYSDAIELPQWQALRSLGLEALELLQRQEGEKDSEG